ncbi:MAG: helix-turn-helix transcriptional regulator [Spirochaetaceae bacterium]|nr:helix-turn-helix transcriptional regulator [Spirochaetaceae bacterium]
MSNPSTQFHELLIKNIKLHRKQHAYSQMKLAELCAVSSNYIGEIEMGRKFPSADTMERLTAALDLKPYQLFVEGNETPSEEEIIERYNNHLKALEAANLKVDLDQAKESYYTSRMNDANNQDNQPKAQ